MPKKASLKAPVREQAAPVKTSAGKAWLFRICAAMLGPLIFCGVIELGLRLFGYGYPTDFFVRTKIQGRDYYVPNDDFGYRFFPRALARTPAAQRMAVNKSPNTFRIFVLGESAALGDPDSSFGAWRYLQVLLRERFPGTDFEVICVAMTAINSHVLLPIARECAKRQGDLWVIYMGNNEMVGPFGGGTVFGLRAPRAGVVRAALAVKTLRLGQLLDHLLERGGVSSVPKNWGGLSMFEQQQTRFDEPNRLRAYNNYKENLEDILRAANKAGVPVILSTVGSNLKDCGPFGSLHPATLSQTQKQDWQAAYQKGRALQSTGDYSGALKEFKQAAEVDPHFAELQFSMGRCELALTNTTQALHDFELARDYDTLAFRADSRINQILKEAAQTHAGNNVHLLDADQLFAQSAPDKIPGNELFYEHVHLNFDANYVLARALAEETSALLPKSITGHGHDNWASQEVCERRLAITSWDRFRVWGEILNRVSRPPFTEQSTHNQLVALCQQNLDSLKAKADRESREDNARFYESALALAPDDGFLHWNFAQISGAKGDLVKATDEAKRVCALLPQSLGQYYDIGNLLILQGKIDEAAEYFSRALAREGNFVNALNGMGLIRQNEQKTEEAAAYFKRALRIDENNADTYLNLGFLEQNQGRLQEAAHYYQRAAQLQPNGPLDYLSRAVTSVALGNRPQALEAFHSSTQLKPDFWQAHYLLGNEMEALGDFDSAREEFLQAVRYRPDFAKAHLSLGVVFSKQQKLEQALNEFQTTLQIAPGEQLAQQFIDKIKAARGHEPGSDK